MNDYFCNSCGKDNEYPIHDEVGHECIYMECECLCHE